MQVRGHHRRILHCLIRKVPTRMCRNFSGDPGKAPLPTSSGGVPSLSGPVWGESPTAWKTCYQVGRADGHCATNVGDFPGFLPGNDTERIFGSSERSVTWGLRALPGDSRTGFDSKKFRRQSVGISLVTPGRLCSPPQLVGSFPVRSCPGGISHGLTNMPPGRLGRRPLRNERRRFPGISAR